MITKLETNILTKNLHVILLSLLEVEVHIPVHLLTTHNNSCGATSLVLLVMSIVSVLMVTIKQL